MSGQHGFAKNYNVQFRAPELAGLHAQGPAIMYWMINDDVPSLLGPMDGEGLWYFIATRIDEKDELDPKAMIRKATHLDFEMEILGGDPWYAHNLIADKYSDGRIFLAGDACHLHPPFGGYGMNMGYRRRCRPWLEDGRRAAGLGRADAARQLRAGTASGAQVDHG